MVWHFSPLDINTLGMINSGSWLFGYDIERGKLQESLGKTLLSYPVFTGRCIGKGIEYYDDCKAPQIDLSESDAVSSDIKGLCKLPAAFKAGFDLGSFRNGNSFPLSIKVIKLADSSLLSIAVSHSCCDGATLYRFVNDWGRTFRGEPIEKPLFDQTLLPSLTDSKEGLMKILPAEGWHPVSLKALFSHIGDEIRGISRQESETVFLPGIKSNAEVCKILSERAGNSPAFIYVVDMRGRCMSMYAVNAGVPKTLVRHLVRWAAENKFPSAKEILLDIVDTPVSPELLPTDSKGRTNQITEDVIGPYELHDFFLYNFFRFGYAPDKIFFLARKAFPETDPEVIMKWLRTFIRRFFGQQFKRS